MNRISKLIFVCALCAFSGMNATCQTVKLLADVEVSWPGALFPYSTQATVDGRHLAYAIDTIGVIRLQTYPTERRDTVAIPDSVKAVRCVGFVSEKLLLTYESRSTGKMHFATIDIAGNEWTSIPDLIPPVHPVYGVRSRYIEFAAAPGRNTAVLGCSYMSLTSPSTTRYFTTIINTQTIATLQTYDSLGSMMVSPGGREYYCTKLAPDSSAWLCLYFDAATGARLRTVRCRGEYDYSTGIDHVMYTDNQFGSIDEKPVMVLQSYQIFNGQLAAPNIFCRTRATGNVKLLETYDVLDGTTTLIDTIHSNSVIVRVNDVDHLIFVQTIETSRFRVYSYDGLQGREGLACIRSADTALVFSDVDYSTFHVSRTRNANITCTIDGKEYAMKGRKAPLSLRANRLGQVPFSATARNAQGVVVDSTVRAPLIVRRPRAFTDAVQVRHAATELALSEDEQSISVVSDSMTTLIPILGGNTPTLDTAHARVIRNGSLHATQSPLLPSNAYVKIVLRDDDPNSQEYHRSLDQLVVGFNGDSSLIRSVLLPPEMVVRKVQTVWNAADSLLGMAVFTSNAAPARLFLSKHENGAWVQVGDSSGIEIPNGNRVDISVLDRIMVTGASGYFYVKDMSDGTEIIDTSDGQANALLANDSTVITSFRVWKLREGTWQAQPNVRGNIYLNADAIRLSSSASFLFRRDRNMIGSIVDHASSSIVDSLDHGFQFQQSAVYSKRYRGLFVGYFYGEVGFVPINTSYLDPTSVAYEPLPRAHGSITSCALYTVQGSRVASVACTAPLSATDVESLHVSNGLYFAVYTQENGNPFTQMIVVGK